AFTQAPRLFPETEFLFIPNVGTSPRSYAGGPPECNGMLSKEPWCVLFNEGNRLNALDLCTRFSTCQGVICGTGMWETSPTSRTKRYGCVVYIESPLEIYYSEGDFIVDEEAYVKYNSPVKVSGVVTSFPRNPSSPQTLTLPSTIRPFTTYYGSNNNRRKNDVPVQILGVIFGVIFMALMLAAVVAAQCSAYEKAKAIQNERERDLAMPGYPHTTVQIGGMSPAVQVQPSYGASYGNNLPPYEPQEPVRAPRTPSPLPPATLREAMRMDPVEIKKMARPGEKQFV
ncbi:hypothetical protein HDU67_008080, partial [Dinochytrium kinnereticum]